MKQGQIILACKTLDKMLRLDIPFALKAKLYGFRRTFQAQWDFQLEQENEIISKAKKTEIDGREVIPPEEVNKINKELAELSNTSIDIDFKRLQIEINDDTNALSALDDSDFKALDNFVEWGD